MDTHQKLNRSAWQENATLALYRQKAQENWESRQPHWGIWSIPNSNANLLPDVLSGSRCLEVGCGTAYVSRWMEQRGGEVFALDPSRNQLDTAFRQKRKYASNIRLIEGFAESLPFPDDCFDFVISEYGASLWADPYLWLPEVSRVSRVGAHLVFMSCHVLAQLCAPDSDDEPHAARLLRPYLEMYRLEWTDPNTVEFTLTHGKMIELLVANHFRVDQLLELGAPPNARSEYIWADTTWASQWPTEEVWFATKIDG